MLKGKFAFCGDRQAANLKNVCSKRSLIELQNGYFLVQPFLMQYLANCLKLQSNS
jgi:hypothetical protein